MNTLWSDFIQTSEELFSDRRMRFREDNRALWLEAIGAKPGDDILEVGCAGGEFLSRLAEFVPGIKLTGVDLDDGHIAFAKQKAKELGFDCDFIAADAASMPFPDSSFDLCFSYTVVEHIPADAFFGEQTRVLKPGGRLAVLTAVPKLNLKPGFAVSDEEDALFGKLCENSFSDDIKPDLGAYSKSGTAIAQELASRGYAGVTVKVFTVTDYDPDSAGTGRELALAQIENQRLAALSTVRKGMAQNAKALDEAELRRLNALINARFDERKNKYLNGEKLFDLSTSTVLAVAGTKPL